MEKQQVQYAVRIPEALIGDVDKFMAKKEECAIERRLIKQDETGEELGFDPLTGSAICWLALKFIGTAAITIALGVLTSAIYDRLKKRLVDKGCFEIEVRFPTGETMIIRTDKPLDMNKIEKLLRSSATGGD